MPFYADWTFWAVVVAMLALVLSQLPPIHLLLRPRNLEVEVHSRVIVTHETGNPLVGLVLRIGNTGGSQLRVQRIAMTVLRDGVEVAALPATTYFETASATSAVLLVPFTVKPNEHWTHSVNFFCPFDRQTGKMVREGVNRMREDINAKVRAQPEYEKKTVVAAEANVAPFLELFKKLFIWFPGEYVVHLSVVATPGSGSYSRSYRFTLFESDTASLEKLTEDYKFGAGIIFTTERHVGVSVPISE